MAEVLEQKLCSNMHKSVYRNKLFQQDEKIANKTVKTKREKNREIAMNCGISLRF